MSRSADIIQEFLTIGRIGETFSPREIPQDWGPWDAKTGERVWRGSFDPVRLYTDGGTSFDCKVDLIHRTQNYCFLLIELGNGDTVCLYGATDPEHQGGFLRQTRQIPHLFQTHAAFDGPQWSDELGNQMCWLVFFSNGHPLPESQGDIPPHWGPWTHDLQKELDWNVGMHFTLCVEDGQTFDAKIIPGLLSRGGDIIIGLELSDGRLIYVKGRAHHTEPRYVNGEVTQAPSRHYAYLAQLEPGHYAIKHEPKRGEWIEEIGHKSMWLVGRDDADEDAVFI